MLQVPHIGASAGACDSGCGLAATKTNKLESLLKLMDQMDVEYTWIS